MVFSERKKVINKGFRTSLHKMCHFGVVTTMSWSNRDPAGYSRDALPLPTLPTRIQIGVFPRRQVITRDKFYLTDPSVGRANVEHLLCLLPCDLTYAPFNPQAPSHSWAQGGIDISFYLSVFGPLTYVRFACIWKQICFSPVNWSHVSLILRPARRTLKSIGKIFLCNNILWRLTGC